MQVLTNLTMKMHMLYNGTFKAPDKLKLHKKMFPDIHWITLTLDKRDLNRYLKAYKKDPEKFYNTPEQIEELTPVKPPVGKRRKVTDEMKQNILDDLKAGMTNVAVAEKYKLNRKTIFKIRDNNE